MCLLHTQHARSLPGAVSNPAHLHKQLRQPSQRSPANTTLKGEHRLSKGLTLWVGEISLRLPAPAWERELVLLPQLFRSSFAAYKELCLAQLLVWEQVGPSQP